MMTNHTELEICLCGRSIFRNTTPAFCANIQSILFLSKRGTKIEFHRLVSEGTSSRTLFCILKAEYKMI